MNKITSMRLAINLIKFLIFWSCFSSCTDNCGCNVENHDFEHNDSVIKVIDSVGIWNKLDLVNLDEYQNNSYRLGIFPSFYCEKRVFTLVNIPDSSFIVVNYYDTSDDLEIILTKREKYYLDNSQVLEFEKQLDDNCFWTTKSDGRPSLDGITWIIEGKIKTNNSCSKRNSHIVLRKATDSIFFELCDKFLTLARTSFNEQNDFNSECWTGH